MPISYIKLKLLPLPVLPHQKVEKNGQLNWGDFIYNKNISEQRGVVRCMCA